MPEDWKTAIILPLYKKRDPELTRNYGGIALLSTTYKIYTEIIRERLEKEVEEKNLLLEGQAGFRKGRSTMDNIFVLNYIVQRVKKKKKIIYAMFIDFKAAFDTVDRKDLWKIMGDMGINEYVVERLKGIYEETKIRIRMKNELTKELWIARGVRQGVF